MPECIINGLRFHVEERGSGKPLMLLHGFTGSSRTWGSLTASLNQTHRTVAIDVIGHGASGAPQDAARYAFAGALQDLSCVSGALGIKRAPWLGYSMGGRLALGLALRHPARVSALVLESASPGIADPGERDQRKRADGALADRIEQIGVDAFIAEWERLPMWQSQAMLSSAQLQHQREIRLGSTPIGLAGSLRGMGAGVQPSFWDELEALSAPVLVITGELDGKFTRVGRQMVQLMPQAELAVVPNAGHAVHLEQPERYLEIVTEFLSRHDR